MALNLPGPWPSGPLASAPMTARYAIYDPRTDRDVAEFPDLPEAYVEIDRLTGLHGRVYGIRLARAHRAQVERDWQTRNVRSPLERVVIGE